MDFGDFLLVAAICAGPFVPFWLVYRMHLRQRDRKRQKMERERSSGESDGRTPRNGGAVSLNFEYVTLQIVVGFVLCTLLFALLAHWTGIRWLNDAGLAVCLAILVAFVHLAFSRKAYEKALADNPAWTRGNWIFLNLVFHVLLPVVIVAAVAAIAMYAAGR